MAKLRFVFSSLIVIFIGLVYSVLVTSGIFKSDNAYVN